MPAGSCDNCGVTGDRYLRGQFGYCVGCNAAGFNSYDRPITVTWDDLISDDYDDCPDDDDYQSESEGRGIHQWDYRPCLNFRGDGPYYLGFELEIGTSSFDVAPIYEWCDAHDVRDLLYVKEDGSVDGFEIVSHPMTPEFFDSVPWSEFFEMLNTHYPYRTGREHSEAVGHGLHVHVSRTAFEHKSTLARWTYLLHRNRDAVERVARRSSSRWAAFSEYPVRACLPYERHDRSEGQWVTNYDAPMECGCCYERTWHDSGSLPARATRQYQSVSQEGRYAAVNLTNTDTVEVRVFRSTRKVDEFVSSIHFVAATVNFARDMQPCHATRQSVAWETFADYVRSHPVFAADIPTFLGVEAPPPSAATPSLVRDWARQYGFAIGSRGRIPSDIHRAYVQSSGGIPPHTLVVPADIPVNQSVFVI